MIKRVKLYINSSKSKAVELSRKVEASLIQNGYEIVTKNADLVIGFGGDGTLLKWLSEQKENPKEKYIGINCGTLGFMQDFEVEDVDIFVENLPNYICQRLHYVELQYVKESITQRGLFAINDFSILNAEDKTFRANVCIDDELLETYVGTGLIFASPTGSTARSLSSVGSIMFPEIRAMQMTPIEPIVNSKMHCMPKSICIPAERKVTLTPANADRVKIVCDGTCVYEGNYESISVCISNQYITTLKDKKSSFVKKIREKLI